MGNIPLPIQTNVTGQVLTGIAPVNIGAFSSTSDLLNTLPLTGSIVNITHSNTAFYQLTRSNVTEEDKPRIVQRDELAKLPNVAALFASPTSHSSEENDSSNSVESNDD